MSTPVSSRNALALAAFVVSAGSSVQPVSAQRNPLKDVPPQARGKKSAAPKGSLPSPSKKTTSFPNLSQYLIGPDDVLSITVLRHPEFSVTAITVPGSGVVALPIIGNVQVSGKTVAQIDAEMTSRFKARLLRPEIVVSIAKPAPRPIYVVGPVKTPSVLEFKNGWRITNALAAAGGLIIDKDLASVTVTRGKLTVADVPLLPILADSNSAENIELQVGDSLNFYERVVKVNVLGEVTRPGLYTIPKGSGVTEAIGLAGGPTLKSALSRATLRRSNGTVLPVNLYEALRSGDDSKNVTLVEGDVLSVPEFTGKVSILGAVKAPGNFSLEDGRKLRIADVIARAGGQTESAALTRATLRRANGQTVALNLYSLLVRGEETNNLELTADDVLTIPETRGITVIGEVQKPGTYHVDEGTVPRVSDALALASGLKIKPEMAKISISRSLANGKQISLNIDAVSLLELSNSSQNSLMQDGDIVSVNAQKMATVSIAGQVKTPNAYEMRDGEGLGNLLARAGGPSDKASLSKVAVTSLNKESGKRETHIVDAVSILRDGRDPGLVLHDGDYVYVPENLSRILVVGAVSRPGNYPLQEDRPTTIGDALGLAGGTMPNARAKTVTLLRETPKGVERLVMRLDQAQDGKIPLTQVVQNGDVLYLPEGRVSASTLSMVTSFLPSVLVGLR